jgi:hypothetical protein
MLQLFYKCLVHTCKKWRYTTECCGHDFILKELSANGVEFTKSDVAALSQYLTRHIKRFGDYVIDLDNVPNAIDTSISIPIK